MTVASRFRHGSIGLMHGIAALFVVGSAGGDPPQADPAASKALHTLITSMRSQPGLRIQSVMTLKATDPEGTESASEPLTAEFVYRKDGAGVLEMRDMTCIFQGGVFNATHKSTVKHSYFTQKYDGVPYWMLLDAFRDLPFPHIALLWGDATIEDVCMELSAKTTDLAPMSVQDEMVDGRLVRRIVLSSDEGSMTFTVDPATNAVTHALHEIHGGAFVKDGVRIVADYTITTETLADPAVDARFTFQPGDRQRVDLMTALIDRPPHVPQDAGGDVMAPGGRLVGQPAPPFVLTTADGKAVDLTDYQGQVIVLDFWATWCPPCRVGLPVLHEASKWAQQQGLPATIFTINTLELRDPGRDTPEARLAQVKKFWTAQKFFLPVLMDYSDQTSTAYGVNGIPTTVIIRSDGVVHAYHVGLPGGTDELLALLKKDIQEAVAALEAPGDPAAKKGDGR
jgi:thiol-disulfide isomerase/thioredoxin